MPELLPSGSARLVVDLTFEVDDGTGQTTAHLFNVAGGMLLDVQRPDVLARALPRASGSTPTVFREVLRQSPLTLGSGGRRLGEVRLTRRGRVWLKPTVAGLGFVLSTVGARIRRRF